jgi:hypothetical protein
MMPESIVSTPLTLVYELQVENSGFRSYVGAGIQVEANRVTTIDPRLEVGTARPESK